MHIIHACPTDWFLFRSITGEIDAAATVREFTRRFPTYRRAALAGKEVVGRDRADNGFVFRSADEKSVSLADAMGDPLGSVQTSQRKKSLSGCDRH
jgi:hypothetical protein